MIRPGILVGMLCVSMSVGADAQPVGVRGIGDDRSNCATFTVAPHSYCRFEGTYNGQGILIEGACQWQSTSQGGILTIMNIHNYQPAPIRYDIVWINQTTITTWGDVYHKMD